MSGGPYRVQVILRSPAVPILLTERDFAEGLARAAVLLPALVERWPGLSRVDARVPDRLLVRSEPPAVPEELAERRVGGAPE